MFASVKHSADVLPTNSRIIERFQQRQKIAGLFPAVTGKKLDIPFVSTLHACKFPATEEAVMNCTNQKVSS